MGHINMILSFSGQKNKKEENIIRSNNQKVHKLNTQLLVSKSMILPMMTLEKNFFPEKCTYHGFLLFSQDL